METSAVFWEHKIKTYGFQLEKDLSLVEIKIQPLEMGPSGSFIEILKKQRSSFTLLLGLRSDEPYLNLCLAVKRSDKDHLLDPVTRFEEKNQCDAYGDVISNSNSFSRCQRKWDCRVIRTSVELIYFQGPHYSDRYGIAYAAFEALESKGISIIASGCSVSCVYLILAEGYGDKALDILKERFEVPRKRKIKE